MKKRLIKNLCILIIIGVSLAFLINFIVAIRTIKVYEGFVTSKEVRHGTFYVILDNKRELRIENTFSCPRLPGAVKEMFTDIRIGSYYKLTTFTTDNIVLVK